MADPLSIATGVIGLAATFVSGFRKISEEIDNFRDAPEELKQLRERVDMLVSQLEELTKILQSGIQLNMETQIMLESAVEKCMESCNSFFKKLQKLPQFPKDKPDLWPRLKLSVLKKSVVVTLINNVELCRNSINSLMISLSLQILCEKSKFDKDISVVARTATQDMNTILDQVTETLKIVDIRLGEVRRESARPYEDPRTANASDSQDQSLVPYSPAERQDDMRSALQQLLDERSQAKDIQRLIRHQLDVVIPEITKNIPMFVPPPSVSVTFGSNTFGVQSYFNPGTINNTHSSDNYYGTYNNQSRRGPAH